MHHIFSNDHFSNSIRNTDKSHIGPTRPPRWLWRGTFLAAALVGAVTLLAAAAIALGAADPPRAERLVWESDAWPAQETVTLAPRETDWAEAPVSLLASATFTLSVRARLAGDADPGAAWGVWIEAADGARIVYAHSGEGYTTTRRCPPGELPPALEACPALRAEWRWTAYPRVRPPGETNHVALHREQPGHVRLWLNGERLGITALDPAGAWGVWWRGGRNNPSALTWEHAALYRG
jgi:hypothetical protein